jgi:hypothetical protein
MKATSSTSNLRRRALTARAFNKPQHDPVLSWTAVPNNIALPSWLETCLSRGSERQQNATR